MKYICHAIYTSYVTYLTFIFGTEFTGTKFTGTEFSGHPGSYMITTQRKLYKFDSQELKRWLLTLLIKFKVFNSKFKLLWKI